MSGAYEAWIAADPFRRDVRVLTAGPQGFERTVQFGIDESKEEIKERVRATLKE